MKILNLVGQKFGALTVLEEVPKREGSNQKRYRCYCEACGNDNYYIDSGELRRKRVKTKTCGCKIGIYKDISGQRFGKLVAIKELPSHNWLCKCDCGNKCEVKRANLNSGNTQSCGCIHSKGEYLITQILNENNINFKKQFSFNDLLGKGKHPLLFDFALFDKNNNLIKIIEYDGIQHFDKNNNYYNQEVENNKIRKNQYCKEHNIIIQNIPYFKYDIINYNFICSDVEKFLKEPK